MGPIYRRTFDLVELAERFPPRFTNPNKVAFQRRVGGDAVPGEIEVTRWETGELPAKPSEFRSRLIDRLGFFTYDEGDTLGRSHWHMNFAHYDLFAPYAGPLLAQDEMQVLEHPDLASVRIALKAEGRSTLVTDRGRATPFLITGVPRRGALDTGPGPGRPAGLYGSRFAAASVDQVLGATTKLDPPTISNIVAIEAAAYGHGLYTKETITEILTAAHTGFGAVVSETRSVTPSTATVIHTGWWGCGAYGGNQELMALLQLKAAEWAEVDELVFHLGGGDTKPILARAKDALDELPEVPDDFVAAIVARAYRWGVSDGN